jgi:hypothetical protein
MVPVAPARRSRVGPCAPRAWCPARAPAVLAVRGETAGGDQRGVVAVGVERTGSSERTEVADGAGAGPAAGAVVGAVADGGVDAGGTDDVRGGVVAVVVGGVVAGGVVVCGPSPHRSRDPPVRESVPDPASEPRPTQTVTPSAAAAGRTACASHAVPTTGTRRIAATCRRRWRRSGMAPRSDVGASTVGSNRRTTPPSDICPAPLDSATRSPGLGEDEERRRSVSA